MKICLYYEQVLNDLTEALVVNRATAEADNKAYDELIQLGNEDLALNIVGFYRDQFYAEFVLANVRLNPAFFNRRNVSEFNKLSDSDLVTYAALVYASIRALSSVDVEQIYLSDNYEPVRRNFGNREDFIEVSGDYPNEPIRQSISHAFENAINEMAQSQALSVRLKTALEGVRV